jgi:hypothetical protein
MSLSNTDVKDTYSGNGLTIYFPYTFTLPSSSTGSEVAVYITDSYGATGDKLTTGYTVDLDNQRVIYPDPYDEDGILPSGYKITLIRETPLVQNAVYSGQSFNPKSFERSLDKAVMMIQEMNDKVERAVIASVTSEVNYTLPEAEAEKVLGWNTVGDGLVNYDNPAVAEEQAIASAAAAAASQTAAANSATSAANQVTLATDQVVLATTQATNAANSATAAAESALEASATNKVWKANLTYITDNICYPTAIRSNLIAECVIGGTSGTAEPTWALGLITDGTVTWLVRDTRNISPAMSLNNVTITNTSTVITLAAGALIGLRNSTGTRIINILTLTDITLTPTLAASTAYYLWLVHTASTNATALVLTTSYTAPSYDYYRYLGGRFTDSSSRLYIIKQVNDECSYIVDGTILTGLKSMASDAAPEWTAVNTSPFVPSTASLIYMTVGVGGGKIVTIAPNNHYPNGSTSGHFYNYYNPAGGYQGAPLVTILLESSYIYWYNNGSSNIGVSGWKENL